MCAAHVFLCCQTKVLTLSISAHEGTASGPDMVKVSNFNHSHHEHTLLEIYFCQIFVLELNRFLDKENQRQVIASFGTEQKCKNPEICIISWHHPEWDSSAIGCNSPRNLSNYRMENRDYDPWSNRGDAAPQLLGDFAVDQHWGSWFLCFLAETMRKNTISWGILKISVFVWIILL